MGLSEQEQKVFDRYKEQAIAENMQDWPDTEQSKYYMFDDILAEASHFSLDSLVPGEQVLLWTEDNRMFQFTAISWKGEQTFEPHVPVLARVQINQDNVLPDINSNDLIVVDGASIQNYRRPEDQGTIAEMCNLTYYTAVRKPYIRENDWRPDELIEKLEKIGVISYIHGIPQETEISSIPRFTPRIVSGMYGEAGFSIFN